MTRGPRRFGVLNLLCLLVEYGIAAFLIIGESTGGFGFDFPGKWGLNFDDVLKIAGILLMVNLASLCIAVKGRHWLFLAMHLLITAALALLFFGLGIHEMLFNYVYDIFADLFIKLFA